MSICNHGLAPEKCILCKKLLPPEPPQNHKMAAPLPIGTFQATNTDITVVAATIGAPVVQILNAPQITDPQAKNVLQLAQEYAQAQDDVSIIRANVKQLQDTLAESKIKLGEAEKSCATKKRVLNEAINPVIAAKGMEHFEDQSENEEPSYVSKYAK